jgi:hypothetical protein
MTATATASPTGTPSATPSASPSAAPTGTQPVPRPGEQVFHRGAIQSINGNFYQVAGVTVQTDPTHTIFNNADGTPTTASAFAVGDRVRVVGFQQQDGTLFAQKFSFDTP